MPDTLISEIRLYFTYEVPNTIFYLYGYCEIVAQILRRENFKCPGYYNLYIAIGETEHEAINRTFILEDWYTFGIAILNRQQLLEASHEDQERLILKSISDGLKDISILDGLDNEIIERAIDEARKIGVMTERIINSKENGKIRFTVSAKPLRGKFEQEVFLTLEDKKSERIVKWKFGEEDLYTIGSWFWNIKVTNKLINTKNRIHSDMILKGKPLVMEFDVEKEFAQRL